MHAANQPHFRTTELFLNQRAKIAARPDALVVATGHAHAKGALAGLSLQTDQQLAQHLHRGTDARGTGGLQRFAPQRVRADFLQQLLGALGQHQSHHPPVTLVGVARDQAFTRQHQYALRHGAFGQTQIFGRALRRITEPIGLTEIHQDLQMDGLQPMRQARLTQTRARQRA